jgi:hypothetical protein
MIATVRRPRLALLVGGLLAGLAIAAPPGRADQRVGVDSAVNPNAMGIPPGALPRRLVLGQDILFNERITTEATGQTQILFVDESTLSIGPNANMVIDQFVFDPNTGAGKLAASLTRGVFRFVGGKLSKQENAVSFRTPAATIGIRGGAFLVRVRECVNAPAGCNVLDVEHVYGKATTVTTPDGQSKTIFRSGFGVHVARVGEAISDPAPEPPGTAAALLAQLDGRPGSTGGAAVIPTDVMVVQSGIASVVSANLSASLQAAQRTQPTVAQPNNVNAVVAQTQLNNQNVQVSAATGTTTNGETVSVAGFSNPNPAPIPTPVAGFRRFVPGGSTPFGEGAPGGNTLTGSGGIPVASGGGGSLPGGGTTVPVGSGGNSGGTGTTGTGGGTSSGTPPNVTASVAGAFFANGTLTPYARDMITKGVFNGSGFSFPLSTDPTAQVKGTSPLGPVTGTTYVASDGSFFYANLTTTGRPAQHEFIYGGTPILASGTLPHYLAFNVQAGGSLQSSIPFLRLGNTGSLGGTGSASPLILARPLFAGGGSGRALQASLAIAGTGSGQSSVIAVLVGDVFQPLGSDSLQPVINGAIQGSYAVNNPSQPVALTRFSSPFVTPLDGNGTSFYGTNNKDGSITVSGFVLSNGGCCSESGAPTAAPAVATNPASHAVGAYPFVQPATPTQLPQNVANATPANQNLTGYFGGVMTREPNPGSSASPVAYTVVGTATIAADAANQLVEANLKATKASPNSGIGQMALNFGTLNRNVSEGSSAYVTNNVFAAVENPTNPSTVNGVRVPVSNPGTGITNGTVTGASNIYLVSQGATPANPLLPSGGLCSTCAYLQWGYWGGELDTPAAGNNPARIDAGHINFWVAGSPATSPAQIAALRASGAVGSYAGNLIGTVQYGGAQYLASGGLHATYAFASQIGTFTVSNYDKLPTFTAAGRAPLNGSKYGFSFAQNGLSGSVNGGFYGPGATETAGNFAFATAIKGSPYLTSGVFAAGAAAKQ